MIGRIAGRLDWRGDGEVLIDVHGVGYIVQVSDRTLAALPALGEGCALWTELIVREDLLQLVGFLTLAEKEWHRLLTTVQGVGTKAAMAMLGALGAEGVGRAIALGDVRAIQAAPGVGPKIASRVVLELKSKAPSVMAMGGAAVLVEPPVAGRAGRAAPAPDPSAQAVAEALSALGNLGYGPGDAAAAVAQSAADAPGADVATLIRAALRRLAPRER